MNEQLQQRHNDLQNELIKTREQLRQLEQKATELQNVEQQLMGAIAEYREFMQMVAQGTQPIAQPPLPLGNAAP